jgi:hypothetical protein
MVRRRKKKKRGEERRGEEREREEGKEWGGAVGCLYSVGEAAWAQVYKCWARGVRQACDGREK